MVRKLLVIEVGAVVANSFGSVGVQWIVFRTVLFAFLFLVLVLVRGIIREAVHVHQHIQIGQRL